MHFCIWLFQWKGKYHLLMDRCLWCYWEMKRMALLPLTSLPQGFAYLVPNYSGWDASAELVNTGFVFVSLNSQTLLPLTTYQGKATEEEKFCKDLPEDSASLLGLDGSQCQARHITLAHRLLGQLLPSSGLLPVRLVTGGLPLLLSQRRYFAFKTRVVCKNVKVKVHSLLRTKAPVCSGPN